MKPKITWMHGGWLCEGGGENAWSKSPVLSFLLWNRYKAISDQLNRALGIFTA